MDVLIVILLTIVALGGTAVALTRRPEHQALLLAGYGMSLALAFMILQAPDVALSQIGVGTALVPLMVMLAIRKTRRGHQ